ncbi:MAG TPA: RIO1 family regulatory kinase/ATPase, partial [Patescibacteria group bacterium]|nr:RIO1 family regulatory kinase/ATPase [Patescibacteria group bacterium]
MTPHLLYQGAEAKILLSDDEEFIIKDRIKKSYRIKELDDKIRKQRTKSEAKLLEKASKIINVPKPLPMKEFNIIKMPYIKGKRLSENLDFLPLEKQKEIMKIIGEETAKLHDADIIHGDLTTSNMILVEGGSDNGRNNVGDERAVNN